MSRIGETAKGIKDDQDSLIRVGIRALKLKPGLLRRAGKAIEEIINDIDLSLYNKYVEHKERALKAEKRLSEIETMMSKKGNHISICDQCKREHIVSRKDNIYCSRTCKNNAQKKKKINKTT